MLQHLETVRWCHQRGVVVQGYGSNGGIWQLGRRRPELDFLRMAPLQAAAHAHGVSVHQVSLRWSLQRGVTVIPMSFDPAHQRENLQLFDFALTPSEMAAIDALAERVSGTGVVVRTAEGVDKRSLYGFGDPEMIA